VFLEKPKSSFLIDQSLDKIKSLSFLEF